MQSNLKQAGRVLKQIKSIKFQFILCLQVLGIKGSSKTYLAGIVAPPTYRLTKSNIN